MKRVGELVAGGATAGFAMAAMFEYGDANVPYAIFDVCLALCALVAYLVIRNGLGRVGP